MIIAQEGNTLAADLGQLGTEGEEVFRITVEIQRKIVAWILVVALVHEKPLDIIRK